MWSLLESLCGNLWITLGLAILTGVVYYLYSSFSNTENWAKYGVKQAKLGNKAFTDFRLAYHELLQEHGDTVGMVSGKMFLFTTNLELIRMIMVKDFNSFADKDEAFQTKSHMEKGLFFIGGADWKRVRRVVSSSFSSGKLKSFMGAVNQSARKLTSVVEDQARAERPVVIKELAGQYTSQIIAKVVFGLPTDCIGKEDDEFTRYCKQIFKDRFSICRMIVSLFIFQLPTLYTFLLRTLKVDFFDQVNLAADRYFTSVLDRTIAERRELIHSGKTLRTDFLQSLVLAKEQRDKAEAAAASRGPSVQAAGEIAHRSLTEEELYGQILLFRFAGFETVATTLQFCLYLLAKHPDVQERLYQEVNSTVESEVPTYKELSQLNYMDQVISETLRLYPPAPIVTRKALETKTYGSVTIPAGTIIGICLDLVMLDPNNFEDPEKFDPDRFTEENKAKRDPMTNVAFGFGPRLCIGRRLALLELKVGLVNLVRKIRFELDERLKKEEVIIKFQAFIFPDKPIKLIAKLRE